MVVSADVAGDVTSNGNFISYAGTLSKGLLRRVVLDECHLIFTSSDWRPKLAKLKNLRLLQCPMVPRTTQRALYFVRYLSSLNLYVNTNIRGSTSASAFSAVVGVLAKQPLSHMSAYSLSAAFVSSASKR
jgi:hypothetical protein